jgi:hypothetical protein
MAGCGRPVRIILSPEIYGSLPQAGSFGVNEAAEGKGKACEGARHGCLQSLAGDSACAPYALLSAYKYAFKCGLMCRCIFKQHIYIIYIYTYIYIITHTLKLMFYAQPPCPSLMPGAALLSERRDASGLACQHEKNKQEKGSKLHIGLGCVVLGLLAACRRHATARRCQVTRGRRGPGGTRAHVLNALGHSMPRVIHTRQILRSKFENVRSSATL